MPKKDDGKEQIGRTEVTELMRLFHDYIVPRTHRAIEQGKGDAKHRRTMREKLGAGVYVLQGVLEEVERYAKP